MYTLPCQHYDEKPTQLAISVIKLFGSIDISPIVIDTVGHNIIESLKRMHYLPIDHDATFNLQELAFELILTSDRWITQSIEAYRSSKLFRCILYPYALFLYYGVFIHNNKNELKLRHQIALEETIQSLEDIITPIICIEIMIFEDSHTQHQASGIRKRIFGALFKLLTQEKMIHLFPWLATSREVRIANLNRYVGSLCAVDSSWKSLLLNTSDDIELFGSEIRLYLSCDEEMFVAPSV